MEIALTLFAFVVAFMAFASLLRYDHWSVRIFDFPRLQIIVLLLLSLLLSGAGYSFQFVWQYVVVVVLFIGLLHQVRRVFPYTIFNQKEVIRNRSANNPDRLISILIGNVLMTNTGYDRLLNHIHAQAPDLVLTLESDERWEKHLAPIEAEYPYSIKIPQDNFYGMHLYSKLELVSPKVHYLIEEDVPSIQTKVKLRTGDLVHLFCLHPKPPSPTESEHSTERDAELLLVGKTISMRDEPTLVFGDLNDVAWSRTTRLFRRISGLLDPRIGRGFYNTFHAGIPFMRWPLDHVFHSSCFTLYKLQRLKSIGSDHFPIYVSLNFSPKAESKQVTPESDHEEEEMAREKINKGLEEKSSD